MRHQVSEIPHFFHRLEWRGVRIPFKRPLSTAMGTATARYSLLLSLYTRDGLSGVGEAALVDPGTGEAGLNRLAEALGKQASRLLHTGLSGVPAAARALLGGGEVAKALRFGLETAAYDLLGKAQGQPLVVLLGGTPRPVSVNALLGAGLPQELARLAAEARDKGYTTLKLKLTGALEDLAVLEAVRNALGDGVRIRADVNQAWTVEQAIPALKRMEPFGLEYVEQPVAASDIPGMALLRRAVRIPIAADEAVTGLAEAQGLMGTEAADVLIIKAARVGGIEEALAILRLGQRRGVPTVVTSSIESGVGLAASLHLAAAGPRNAPAAGLATGLLLECDVLSEPLVPTNGLLSTPSKPGLGISVDDAALRRFRTEVSGAATL